jgi:hypothetical protein
MNEQVNMAAIIAALKDINEQDLWEIHDQCAKELKKRTKEPKAPKEPKETTQKPATTWPKWVLSYAEKNGWEPFTKMKDVTSAIGVKTKEPEQMPESIEHNGGFVYKGSENTKKYKGEGKKLNITDATELAKHYWKPKAKEGTRKDLYEEYLRSSEPDATPPEPAAAKKPNVVTPVVPVVPVVPVLPAASPVLPAASPVLPAASPVVEKKLTDAEKAEKKAKKLEKEAKKLEKEAKKLEKEKKKEKKIVKPEDWKCKDDGKAHEFAFKGETFLRDFNDSVWSTDGKDEKGKWKKGEMAGKWDGNDIVPDDEDEEEE